ncbi:hypothetical protein [Helcococcus kunzii]|uniref:hypothetical protein n=1 Tax=Helcococcus kunzii TaxID=40091 RepID=UPI0024AE09EE|nr:hypothetical protein [Helcococcus kunzii]
MDIKQDKLIRIILIFLLCLFMPVADVFADDTYKVNEEIEFGRTYEFDEPVNGSVIVSGAADKVEKVGDVKESKFVQSVPVKVKFLPKKLGLYKLDIEVNVSTKEGTDLSRVDTVYFLVTENGQKMTSDEIEEYLKTKLKTSNKDLINEYTKRPYIAKLEVTNAKIVEKLDKNRTQYTLKINDNAQKIEFKAQADSKDTKINGTLSLNPNSQTMNLLSVSNKDTEVIYTFKWEKPKVKVFKYKNGESEEKLVYDPYNRQEFENLPTQKIKIQGDEFEVYEDEFGNLLIPLKHQNKDELPELYTFSTEGEIFTKFENFVNINGQTFRQEKFNEIFNEDLVLFNLESVQIQDLNYAKGYSINRVGFEKQYLVNLTRPDGFQAWYQFDDRDGIRQLILLDLPEFITENELAKYFGVELDTDYSAIQYSKFDIILVIIAIVSLIIIIVTNIVIKIKKRKHGK